MDNRICVGALGGAFGVTGEVRLKSFTADPEAIVDYSPLTSEDGTREFTITMARPIKNGFAARLSGVETKEEADALRGVRLFAPRDRLPSLPDDEWAKVVHDSSSFWDEVAASSPRSGKVVEAFKKYAANMEKAGYPYR